MSKKIKEEIPELLPIAGNQYYIDLDELSQYIRINKPETVEDILGQAEEELEDGESSGENLEYSQMIDVTKWETIKVLIESILSEQGPVDEAMGPTKLAEQLSIPFRISFNTLIKNKIIKEYNNGR